jgi:ABC-type sugar transport system ATPase subunit
MTVSTAPRLAVRGISKSFPGVKAVDNVSFEVNAGEVHALVGENGAGKSSLMRLLAGHTQPDAGQIFLDGSPVVLRSPLHAKQLGILFVHQEISLIPQLSVAENISLGNLPTKRGARVDWQRLRQCAEVALMKLGCQFGPFDTVARLSIANQQLVEIARALAFKATVIIFDEPTASLTLAETRALFRNVIALKQNGVAIVYISHKLQEIFELADRITILRDGKTQGTLETRLTTPKDVTRRMIGREVGDYFVKRREHPGREILRVVDLTQTAKFEGINLTVREGEILGLYGLVGAGRSELAEAIFGIRKTNRGRIYVDGAEARIGRPKAAIDLGIGFVPENRKEQGLFLNMSGRDNIVLSILSRLQSFGFIDELRGNAIYKQYRDRLSIASSDPKKPVLLLSGGNQQKVLIAKWLTTKPKLLILDEPTRGIDVGAKAEIHKLVADLASKGLAVLLISSEMLEILGLAHRIVTFYHGRLTGEFDAASVTEEQLVTAITGLDQRGPQPTGTRRCQRAPTSP